jgi:hypothetical protein
VIWIALGVDAELWIEVGSVGKLADAPWLQAVASETAETTSNILRAITIDDRNPFDTLIFLLYRDTCELRPAVSLVFLCPTKNQAKPSPVPGR